MDKSLFPSRWTTNRRARALLNNPDLLKISSCFNIQPTNENREIVYPSLSPDAMDIGQSEHSGNILYYVG